MVKNDETKCIGKKTSNNMLQLSHYKFKCRLLNYTKLQDTTVIICDESFTSKTCGHCGTIKNKLAGCEVYKCINCKSTIDRDINGARNILIKSLTSYFA
jgi:putative transposase